MSAFTQLASNRGESTLATWLSRIVMNEALGRPRRKRPTVDLSAESGRSEAEIIQFPLSLRGLPLVLQATLCDGLAFDPFSGTGVCAPRRAGVSQRKDHSARPPLRRPARDRATVAGFAARHERSGAAERGSLVT